MDLGPDRRAERHRPGGNVARTRPPCASPKPRRPAEANAWPDPRGLAGPKTWGSSGHVSSRPHPSSMPVAVAPRIAKRVHLHDCQLSALRAPTGLPCSDSQRLRRKKPPKEFQGSLDQPRARKDGAPGVASGSPRRRVVAAARRLGGRRTDHRSQHPWPIVASRNGRITASCCVVQPRSLSGASGSRPLVTFAVVPTVPGSKRRRGVFDREREEFSTENLTAVVPRSVLPPPSLQRRRFRRPPRGFVCGVGRVGNRLGPAAMLQVFA